MAMNPLNWAVNGLGGALNIVKQLLAEQVPHTRHAKEELEKIAKELLAIVQQLKPEDS